MASTTVNGVVLQVPYAIIRTIRNARPWTLSIVDQRSQLRVFPATIKSTPPGIFVYAGDVISFQLQAPANGTGAAAYDLYSVHPSTGVETKVAEIGFSAVWQTKIKVTITAINGSNGTITYTTAHS